MKNTKCIVCNSSKYDVVDFVPNHTINLRKKSFSRDITNVICKNCGLIYNNPKLDKHELKELYSELAISSNNSKNCIIPISKIEKEQFKFILKYFPKSKIKNSTILDVGCSFGNFLKLFYDLGGKVFGIEPSISDASYAKKINHVKIIQNFFETTKNSIEKFDFISILYVLEHVEDPFTILSKIYQNLKPDGLLFLEVPDSTKPFIGLDPFFTIGHFFSFTPVTLKYFLDKCGFEIIKIQKVKGFSDTLKDFSRIRIIAKKNTSNSLTINSLEYKKMFKIMNKYSHDKRILLKKINSFLDPLIKNWNTKNKKIVIYGAGTHTAELINNTNISKSNLIGIIDKNIFFYDHKLMGYTVFPPDFEVLDIDVIIISARGWENEIYNFLKSMKLNKEIIPIYRSINQKTKMNV